MMKRIKKTICRILTKIAVLYILKYASGKSQVLEAALTVFFDLIDEI